MGLGQGLDRAWKGLLREFSATLRDLPFLISLSCLVHRCVVLRERNVRINICLIFLWLCARIKKDNCSRSVVLESLAEGKSKVHGDRSLF